MKIWSDRKLLQKINVKLFPKIALKNRKNDVLHSSLTHRGQHGLVQLKAGKTEIQQTKCASCACCKKN